MKNNQPVKINITDMIFAFALPTVVGKMAVLYFGLNYGNYPGDGYGYGLLFAVLFTLTMAGRFIWKYRNYKS